MNTHPSVEPELQSIDRQIQALELKKQSILHQTLHHATTERIIRKFGNVYDLNNDVGNYLRKVIRKILDAEYQDVVIQSFECSICKIKCISSKKVTMSCGHDTFCYQCIDNQEHEFTGNIQCPICKTDSPFEDIY